MGERGAPTGLGSADLDRDHRLAVRARQFGGDGEAGGIPDLFQVGLRLFRAADLRLADDFQERCPGSVQIDETFPAGMNPAARFFFVVEHLAGVFFEVDADDANPLSPHPFPSPLGGEGKG